VSASAWRRDLAKLAKTYGCTMRQTVGSHLALEHPDGWRVIASLTPSGNVKRELLNVRSLLRRYSKGQPKCAR
jgi:predicted RNA binding protein YcfA (HicA-like mRNA interferase family)